LTVIQWDQDPTRRRLSGDGLDRPERVDWSYESRRPERTSAADFEGIGSQRLQLDERGGRIVTKALRWRIVALQVVLVLVLGFCAGFLYWGSGFVNGMVHDQLVAQKIYFPAKGSAALDPKEFPDLQQYAGQQVDNGDKAKAYADGFIGRHLEAVAGGKTYSQVSAASQANPQDQKLAAQANTLFKGETLRGLLLYAWGWSQVGLYAFYAAIGLTIATLVSFFALVFELLVAWRPATVRRVATLPA